MKIATQHSPDLARYAENVSHSHSGWLVSIEELVPGPVAGVLEVGRIARERPFRRLLREGDRLVVEYGSGPGRPERHAIVAPRDLVRVRGAHELELRVSDAGGRSTVIRLDQPS